MMAAMRTAFLAACLLLSACVTSTSGRPAPVADNEDAAFYNYQLGARYFRNGNYELARDRLKLSLELDPKRAIAWSTLALTYEKLGNQRLTEDAYQQALRVGPRNYDVLNTYAVYLCRQTRFDDARRYFERAIRVPENDNRHVTMTNAGVCMMQKPDHEQAEAYFREALEHKTGYAEALFQLALLKYQDGDYLNARAFVERYLARHPTNAPILFLAFRIEDELDDQRARSSYADQLFEKFPESREARSVRELL